MYLPLIRHKCLPVSTFLATLGCIALVVPIKGRVHAATQVAENERVLADGARPLAAAVLQVEHRCRCVITYEDHKLRSEDVEDLPGHVPGPETPKVPKGHAFMFRIRRDLFSQDPGKTEQALRDMLVAFEQTDGAGTFRVLRADGAFHVVPDDKSLLDARVTLNLADRPLAEAIGTVMQQVSSPTGEAVKFGTVPANLMMKTLTIHATNERADDVLIRALMSTGRTLSWRLLYDFGYQAFYLNIHLVK